MRHILLKSSVLKTCPWKYFARGFASEPAVQCDSGTDKNPTLGQRWQQHENQVLIAAIKKQDLELEKAGRWNAEQSRRERWEEIEKFCHSKGIYRSAEQCRQRWQRLLHAFSKVKSWESCIPPSKTSFWLMKASERKAEGLPFSLDRKTFNAINLIQSRKEFGHSTASSSTVEEGSTVSPSSNGKPQTDDRSAQCYNKSQHQRETDDLQAQKCAEETINEGMHAVNDVSDTALIGSAQQIQRSNDDDRPLVLANFINQCLVDLKDLDHSSHDAVKAWYETENSTRNEHCGPTEDKYVNADTVNLESMKNKVPFAGRNSENTETKPIE